MSGSNNNINVLESSHFFSNLAQGIAPCSLYYSGNEYNMRYYLADGIYPKWSTIVQTIHELRGSKKQYFATQQEACRKDVERAFGVLQSRFAIVKEPVRYWNREVIHDIMTTCIILLNMIIEDECDLDAPIDVAREVIHDIMTTCIILLNMIIEDERDLNAPIDVAREASPTEVDIEEHENICFQEFLDRFRRIKYQEAYFALRNDLIDHLWKKHMFGTAL